MTDFAYVWASKEPGRYSFNTGPLPRLVAGEYALACAEAGHRTVRVFRADVARPNFLTADLLMEMRSK